MIELLKRNKHTIGITLFSLVVILVTYMNIYYSKMGIVDKKTELVYEESFDLTKVPSGLIIWKHGIPGTEMSFDNADITIRYKFFDIGIMGANLIVYKVRVPYYAIGMFKLGGGVNLKKRNNSTPNIKPKNNSNIYDGKKYTKKI